MGMFDTVLIKCPNCLKRTDHQSKSGDCMLDEYKFEKAPSQVLFGIMGPVKCYNCGVDLVVEMAQKPKFIVRVMSELERKDRRR